MSMDCFDVLMEHLADVYSPTVTTDAGGGVAVAWTTVRTSGVPFVFNVGGGGEQGRFSQEQIIGPVTGATFDTTVQRGDRLTVTAGPTLVGLHLRITGLKSQPGIDFLGFDAIVHVTCEQVQG